MRKSLALTLALILGAAAPALADDMTFQIIRNTSDCANCVWVGAEGQITEATPDRFLKFLSDNRLSGPGRPVVVVLNSPGGNLLGGIKLGGLIRREGLHTTIGRGGGGKGSAPSLLPGKCASACAFVFLGGVVRSAREKELGVHQFYDADALADPSTKAFDAVEMSQQQLIGAIIVNFVVRMGADPRVASIAASTLPTDLHFFTEDELEDLRINWDPHLFGAWSIEITGGGVAAVSRSNDAERTLMLFCRGRETSLRVRIAGLGERATRMVAEIRGRGGVNVLGEWVRAGSVSTYGGGAARGVEFVIGRLVPSSLPRKGLLRIGEPPGVLSSPDYPNFQVPGDRASAAIAIALRNCI